MMRAQEARERAAPIANKRQRDETYAQMARETEEKERRAKLAAEQYDYCHRCIERSVDEGNFSAFVMLDDNEVSRELWDNTLRRLREEGYAVDFCHKTLDRGDSAAPARCEEIHITISWRDNTSPTLPISTQPGDV